MKMHTDPLLITAVTTRLVDCHIAANKKLFGLHAEKIGGCFFGNDYGTQIDLMISPEMFSKFVMPYQKKISDCAKEFGLYTFLHSCGAVSKALPEIIAAGIDGLHPIQALAKGMDAESLARDYKDKLAFIGGVDTQVLLVNGAPNEIKAEVRRIKSLLGPNFFVSPSHEAIMPDVPPENIAAMAEAAHE